MKNTKIKIIHILFVSLFITGSLFGCRGSNDADGQLGGSGAPPADITVKGIIYAPQIITTQYAIASLKSDFTVSSAGTLAACPEPLAGYVFLENSTITVNDQTTTTDSCGYFSMIVPGGDYQVTIDPPDESGYRSVIMDISYFTSTEGTPSLSLPTVTTQNYNLVINSIDSANDIIYVSLTDDTGKQVLGIPGSVVTIQAAGAASQDLPLTNWDTAAATQDSSVSFVFDASGSMDSIAYTDPQTSKNYTKFELADIAARYFINNKSVNDEAGMVVFSSSFEVNFINGAFIDGMGIKERDGNGDPTSQSAVVTYPGDGFTADTTLLNIAADIYSPYSSMYIKGQVSNYQYYLDSYRWRTSTALNDGIYLGTDQLKIRSNPRKFVIAMTDGQENDSNYFQNDVITNAVNAGIPVYAIGFGDSFEIDNVYLTEIADQTGGSFYQATSTDIADAFAKILTQVMFQYIGSAPFTGLSSGTWTITVSINYAGITGEGTINLEL